MTGDEFVNFIIICDLDFIVSGITCHIPITFLRGYFISKYEGTISDEEVLNAYNDFFQGKEWRPGLNELADLSDANVSLITNQGISRLVELNKRVFKAHNIDSVKTAVYAPEDLPFGLARMYSILAEDSPENIDVFRDFFEAKSWIEK